MINVEKCDENHVFLWFQKIVRDYPRASRITLGLTPRCSLNVPGLILRSSFFMLFHDVDEVCPCSQGSRPRTEMAYIPFERSSKTMGNHDLDKSCHGFHVETSWVKGSPGMLGVGTP